MKLRKSILVIVIAITLVLVACQGQQGPAPVTPEPAPQADAPADGAQPEPAQEDRPLDVIRLAIAPTASVAQIYMGQRHGIFEEEGIYLELINFNAMAPAIAAMLAGDLDISFMGLGVHPLAVRGDIDIIFMSGYSTGDYLIGNAEQGIIDFESLMGTTIALPMCYTADMTFRFVVANAGFDPADFNVVNMDIPGTTAAFMSGQVAAAALWTPFVNDIMAHLGEENVHIFGTGGDILDEVAFVGSYGATRSFIENNEDLVYRFTRAFFRSNELVNNNLAETIDYVVERTEGSRESTEAALGHLRFFNPDEALENLVSGRTFEMYRNMINAMNEVGATEYQGDPEDYVFPGIAQRAFESLAG